MNKHTPGPWFRDKYGNVVDSNGNRVTMRSVAVACSGSDEYIAIAEANTDLATAAPELLEALVEVTASLAWNAHGECRAIHEGPIMPSSGAIEMARAAIAKATQ